MSGYKYSLRDQVLSLRNPPSSISTDTTIGTAVCLTVLLIVFAPVSHLITGISLITTIALVGIIYTVVIFRYGVLIEGLLSAFFVLLTFNADVPLVRGPGIAKISVYLLDFGTILVFLLGILWYQKRRPTFSVAFRVVLGSLGGFVLWSFLAAFFGSGSSLAAGLMFSVSQVRILFIFSGAGMVVYWTDIRQALYPLIISVASHLVLGIVQTVTGGIIGFSRLGETSGQAISTFTIGSYTIATGLHAGGFVGTGRVFIAVLLLLTPFFWYAADSDTRFAMATVAVGAITLLVRVGDTESGLGAFFITGLLFLFGILSFKGADCRHYRRLGVAVLSIGMLTGLHLGNTIRAFGISLVTGFVDTVQEIISTDDTTTTEGGLGDPTGQPSDSEGAGPNTNAGSGDIAVDASNLDVRLEQYEASIDIVIENPLFGLGGWNFPLRSTQYQLPEMMAVHNTLLSHLAATGIIGALLYLVAVVAVVLHLIRNVIYGTDRQGLWIAIACGIIGFQAYSFWTTVHHSTTAIAVYWALSGAAVAWEPQGGNDWEY